MADERDMTGEKFLAAEMVGDEIRMTIPNDLLVAKQLLGEMVYRVGQKELAQGFAMREQMKRAQAGGGNGVSIASADILKRLGN